MPPLLRWFECVWWTQRWLRRWWWTGGVWRSGNRDDDADADADADADDDAAAAAADDDDDDDDGSKKIGIGPADVCQGVHGGRLGTRLAFDPTPLFSHMTLQLFCGRVECEK